MTTATTDSYERSVVGQPPQMDIELPIRHCYAILENRDLSSADKSRALKEADSVLLIKNHLQLGVEVPERARTELIKLLIFIFHKGYLRHQLMSNALAICKRFTRLYVAEQRHEEQLLARLQYIFVKLCKPFQWEHLYQLTCISKIMQNLIVTRNGDDSELLADVHKLNSMFSACLSAIPIQCEHIAPKLAKTCLLHWPRDYQSDQLANSSQTLTAGEAMLMEAGLVVADSAWRHGLRRKCLMQFVRLIVETCEDPKFEDLSSTRTLVYSIIAALAIDHELVFDTIDEHSNRCAQEALHGSAIPPSPEGLIRGYLSNWFSDMRSNQFPESDDTIISCRALLRIMSLESSVRPTFFNDFADQIVPCLIGQLGVLEERHKRPFTPPNGPKRHLEPHDRMISEILHRFVTIENKDLAWRDQLSQSLRGQQRRALKELLQFACSRRIRVGSSSGDSNECKQSGQALVPFWAQFFERNPLKRHNSLQCAHIELYLSPDKTVPRVSCLDQKTI